MTKNQFEKITAWQKETFPNATAFLKVKYVIPENDGLIFDEPNKTKK